MTDDRTSMHTNLVGRTATLLRNTEVPGCRIVAARGSDDSLQITLEKPDGTLVEVGSVWIRLEPSVAGE